ncbi:hypothetical protein FHU31_000023 [Mycolicibacterium fluoranthenivorans]|uniref:Uncharacterized protein n=1 Tax=Mycolicibacterium fluoranthenivorans TaxID=258505 RepID=A0A7X5R494_9MYCO|nr:hypothetical protein [Mycolicibacterium fluoranthenivorans]NIH93067.1 hypothetical protein [Mycolicibacterium fluoranthenivorans]
MRRPAGTGRGGVAGPAAAAVRSASWLRAVAVAPDDGPAAVGVSAAGVPVVAVSAEREARRAAADGRGRGG